MPQVERPDGTRIHYEVSGEGPALLLLAPDYVNSEIASWERTPLNPRTAFRGFRTITMDQRYAGQSTGTDAPFSYEQMLGDQIAVLDDAGIEQVAVLGWGIGAAYALGLARAAPGRVSAAALVEPVGREGDDMGPFYGMFDETMRLARAEGLEAVIAAARTNPSFRENPAAGPYARLLHDGDDFVAEALRKGRERYITRVVRFRDGMWPADSAYFSVPEAWLPSCETPLLVIPGNDERHPAFIGERIANEAPHGQLLRVSADDPAIAGQLEAFLLDAVPRAGHSEQSDTASMCGLLGAC
ncbi:MAG: alpha/beta hydrolase [Dehalococcoidia bacterium]|nr:alpha/beta hydrolase [Dehalococcoidia bacterium]